ncbi:MULTISPECIES: hypothetical protein [Bacteria]|uniref:hypothetical protein n=1 Tax=Bacteria TaxID=2 RepID=UPI003C7BB948
MKPQVVVLGAARMDEIRDRRGLLETPAGAGIDAAALLARRGIHSALLAAVADDADGRRIRAMLADLRVRLLTLDAPEGTLRRRVIVGGAEPAIRWEGTPMPWTDAAGEERSAAAIAAALEGVRVVVRAEPEAWRARVPDGVHVTIDLGGAEPRIRGTAMAPEDRMLADAVLSAVGEAPTDAAGRLARSLRRIET